MLINAEKSEYPDTAVNPYRKLLGTNQILIGLDILHLQANVSMFRGLCKGGSGGFSACPFTFFYPSYYFFILETILVSFMTLPQPCPLSKS